MRTLIIAALAITASATLAQPADAQWGSRLKKAAEEAAKRKVEQRVEQRAGEATDKALDGAESGVKCAATDAECIKRAAEKAKAAGGADATAAAPGAPAAGASGAAAASAAPALRPGEGAWANYDFKPGDRVIFAEDFGADNVGDFPRRLQFGEGNIEIVEWQGERFLSTNTFGSKFSVPLPEVLPEQFTLEFDYSAHGGNWMYVYFADPDGDPRPVSYVELGTWSGGLGGKPEAHGNPSGDEYKYQDVVFPVRVMADGQYVKVYMGDTRVANVPNANLGRSKTIYFVLPGRQDRAAMIGNIRVAAGGRKLYDALTASGRVATQGIYFDTGSDVIRGESTPTLKEITAMLTEHADLKLTIEGHTDNVGDAAANKALSEKRAAAVKAYLVSAGVAADRLSTAGFGDTKPAAPNTSAEGRRQNRRVELVKN
jgi:outer membrane protein OmpA-like peptidoglycan-associated protein